MLLFAIDLLLFCQADDSVLACDWQLENDQMWKSLSPEAIAMLTPYAINGCTQFVVDFFFFFFMLYVGPFMM